MGRERSSMKEKRARARKERSTIIQGQVVYSRARRTIRSEERTTQTVNRKEAICGEEGWETDFLKSAIRKTRMRKLCVELIQLCTPRSAPLRLEKMALDRRHACRYPTRSVQPSQGQNVRRLR